MSPPPDCAEDFHVHPLLSRFAGQRQGRYVDIGASHPQLMSITHFLYRLGWRGVNVEPVRGKWQRFQQQRPQDCNLNVAVGTGDEPMEVREQDEPATAAQCYRVETMTGKS